MEVKTHLKPAEWATLFQGKEAEFKERLVPVSPGESVSIKVIHSEPEVGLNAFLYNKNFSHLGPSEFLILDDVIFDNDRGLLFLPFMPEYEELSRQVGQDISIPCNSALSTWTAYGHLLHDQFAGEALYQLHPATRDLPMAFNFYNNPPLTRLVETCWKRPFFIVRENFTRFKRLNLLIHRHLQIKRVQADFLRKEFGVPSSGKPLSFFRSSPPGKRLYIARTRRRKVINEEELTVYLKARGFETWYDTQLDEMTISEQAALFHSASIIVSAHGSHLSNCFFCRPDVVLIELFKMSWVDQAPFCVLRSAAPQARYGYLIDWYPWETWHQNLIHADIRVDMSKLERMLKICL